MRLSTAGLSNPVQRQVTPRARSQDEQLPWACLKSPCNMWLTFGRTAPWCILAQRLECRAQGSLYQQAGQPSQKMQRAEQHDVENIKAPAGAPEGTLGCQPAQLAVCQRQREQGLTAAPCLSLRCLLGHAHCGCCWRHSGSAMKWAVASMRLSPMVQHTASAAGGHAAAQLHTWYIQIFECKDAWCSSCGLHCRLTLTLSPGRSCAMQA